MTDSSRYRPQEIEERWQQHWQSQALALTPEPGASDAAAAEPYYALSMFPYPSGSLRWMKLKKLFPC